MILTRFVSRMPACLTCSALALACAASVGCRSVGSFARGTGGEFVSDEQAHALNPDIRTRVFSSDDMNSADLVFSDLDAATLTDRSAWDGAFGQVIHARMFIQPRPGRTPIEPTACTVTLRYLVLAGDEFGIYAGGGFLLPDGSPDDDTFGGKISDASLRLVSATPGFNDLIGSGRLDLSFKARRDHDAVRRAARNADFKAFGALPVADHPLLITRD